MTKAELVLKIVADEIGNKKILAGGPHEKQK